MMLHRIVVCCFGVRYTTIDTRATLATWSTGTTGTYSIPDYRAILLHALFFRVYDLRFAFYSVLYLFLRIYEVSISTPSVFTEGSPASLVTATLPRTCTGMYVRTSTRTRYDAPGTW